MLPVGLTQHLDNGYTDMTDVNTGISTQLVVLSPPERCLESVINVAWFCCTCKCHTSACMPHRPHAMH